MKRPNILLIYTDQQRWDTLGLNNPLIHTPNLDALARNGFCFTETFVNCPVCMPSRMSMLSGRYPASLRIATNGIEMPEDIPCLQHLLKPYGYHTANLGKLHFRNHSNRNHRDPHPSYCFDTMILSDEPGCYDDAYIKWVASRTPEQVENCRCDTPPQWIGKPIVKHPRQPHHPYVFDAPQELTHTAFVADETVSFLERQDGRQPFFCIAGIYAPHAPINPPEPFASMYDPADMPLPQRLENENLEDVSDEQWRKIKAYYYGLVSHIDDQIGRIMTALESAGLKDDTIVVFTSDHGENLGDHGRVAKTNPHDSATRVPLIISCPDKFAPQGNVPGIVEAVDIAPTIFDCCGVQIPSFMQGRSLYPVLTGEQVASERDSAFIEHRVPFGNAYKALRIQNWLYVMHKSGEENLYDLNDDPHQCHDIVDSEKGRAALPQLRQRLLGRWFEVESQHPKKTGAY